MFREEPLTGSQIMRGAYINSGKSGIGRPANLMVFLSHPREDVNDYITFAGSKDVGRDPDWDPVTRTHRSKTPSTFNPSEEQVEEWSKRFESKEGGQKEGEHEGRE